jgi:hypothetical protein
MTMASYTFQTAHVAQTINQCNRILKLPESTATPRSVRKFSPAFQVGTVMNQIARLFVLEHVKLPFRALIKWMKNEDI